MYNKPFCTALPNCGFRVIFEVVWRLFLENPPITPTVTLAPGVWDPQRNLGNHRPHHLHILILARDQPEVCRRCARVCSAKGVANPLPDQTSAARVSGSDDLELKSFLHGLQLHPVTFLPSGGHFSLTDCVILCCLCFVHT